MDTIDINKSRALALAASFLGEHWALIKEDDLTLNILSGGFSGRLYIVEDVSKTSNSNPQKKFLIRLYGGKLIEKDDILKAEKCESSEGIVFFANGLYGLGPQLLGCFDGGRIEEFVPSHRLTEIDLIDPNLSLELARKLARFHALQLPVPKKKRDILSMSANYQDDYNKDKLMEIIEKFGLNPDGVSFLDEDYHTEHAYLRNFESKVGGRLVLCHGDLNKNNILVRDKPDKFGERIMLIDYELAATDYRGIDLAGLLMGRMHEMQANGAFERVCEWPDDDYRRMIVTEYLRETKKLNYLQLDENGLDSVDHVMMEIDFFAVYVMQFYVGFMKKMTNNDMVLDLPHETVKSWFDFELMETSYKFFKKTFMEKYATNLD